MLLRGRKVILDSDLAELYGVPSKRLNQPVTRNAQRFPSDFRFRLTLAEYKNLRLQFATSSLRHGGRRYLPYVFTEHGAIMAATVLNSKHAIQMSIFVVRAFVRMREALAANRQIVAKLAELETGWKTTMEQSRNSSTLSASSCCRRPRITARLDFSRLHPERPTAEQFH